MRAGRLARRKARHRKCCSSSRHPAGSSRVKSSRRSDRRSSAAFSPRLKPQILARAVAAWTAKSAAWRRAVADRPKERPPPPRSTARLHSRGRPATLDLQPETSPEVSAPSGDVTPHGFGESRAIEDEHRLCGCQQRKPVPTGRLFPLASVDLVHCVNRLLVREPLAR